MDHMKIKIPSEERIRNIDVNSVLRELNIENWDVLIIGDGSGSTWQNYCGWAALIIDRETQGRRLIGGNANMGSITFAEAMPYVQALSWFDHTYGSRRLKSVDKLSVHIVTDSTAIATIGSQISSKSKDSLRKHAYLAAFCQQMAKFRYDIQWHWLRREIADGNRLVDGVSKALRLFGAGALESQ